jgi:tRNA pseudouridine13 synthase
MKLRQLPADFKVEEIGDIPISKTKDNFKLYTLEKEGIETFYLLSYLSKKNNIPSSELSVAGLKDKHAVTKQYLTIPAKYDLMTTQEKNFSIRFVGYTNRKLKLGDLQGNRFEITVRDIKKGELDGVYEKARTIAQIGVPNYFDSQRFGSALSGEFIAKCILQKDYERAVKIFLTSFTKSEKRSTKDEKRSILTNWGDLSRLRLSNKTLAIPIEEYLRTKSWLSAYKRIPPNLREIFISAYQSWLWNECVKELLRRNLNTKYLYSIEYNIGSLLFYKKLAHDEMQRLPKAFKTVSDEIVAYWQCRSSSTATLRSVSQRDNQTRQGDVPYGDVESGERESKSGAWRGAAEKDSMRLEKSIIDKILAKEGIMIEDFKIKDVVGNFFKTREREVILRPSGFSIKQPMIDELNDNGRDSRFKIVVSFTLPKASYATIIIKRLFNQ